MLERLFTYNEETRILDNIRSIHTFLVVWLHWGRALLNVLDEWIVGKTRAPTQKGELI